LYARLQQTLSEISFSATQTSFSNSILKLNEAIKGKFTFKALYISLHEKEDSSGLIQYRKNPL